MSINQAHPPTTCSRSAGRAPRSVSVQGSGEYGYTITVVFDPVATPGDVPQFTITNANVSGTQVTL